MQQQQQPVTPGTPDSAVVLIGAASNAAHDKRHNKTIMNCFRDRSSASASYKRTSSQPPHATNVYIAETAQSSGRPDAVVLLKELRTRPNALALLKSQSRQDLSRLIITDELPIGMAKARGGTAAASELHQQCEKRCTKRMQQLEQRLAFVEQELEEQRNLNEALEQRINQLNARMEQFAIAQQNSLEKRKQKNTTNLQSSKLWLNLSNWFKQRPSIETLKAQNIYNDEPCFDTEIELVLKHEQYKNIPKIVVDCCELIEEKYRRSTEPIEGIYRQCGDYNKIQTLRFKIDANDYDALRQPNIDIHTLTGVLKLFLREIKSPLISANEAKTFVGTPHQWWLRELPIKIDSLKSLVRALPEINRDTLEYLFGHFNRLTKVPLQHISPEVLAVSIAPSIFRTDQHSVHGKDLHELLKESQSLSNCVEIMIEYRTRVFDDHKYANFKNTHTDTVWSVSYDSD